MNRKILLNSSKSKTSVNYDTNIGITLQNNSRVMPKEDVISKIQMDELYLTERDESNRYRFIFNINPICSNVLFNKRTEIVKNEGSEDTTLLIGDVTGETTENVVNTTDLTYLQGIRDTEYSHPEIGPYVYHCGMDICNNHMLRADGFIHVNKASLYTPNDREVFNTIRDYKRTSDGKDAYETRTNGFRSNGDTDITKSIRPHIYNIGNLTTMEEAYNDKVKEVDGWFGFTNPGNIEIPNGYENELSINKLMNNNKACEFIDMYPDRSLYSFIPKVNKYRHRIEYNWDYCLTYPYSNDYEKFNTVVGCGDVNGIRAISTAKTSTNIGTELLQIKTIIKHNLTSDNYIFIYYEKNGEIKRSTSKIKVSTIGTQEEDDTAHILNLKGEEIRDTFPFSLSGNIGGVTDVLSGVTKIIIKKASGNLECKYYFRKFKKLTKIGLNNTEEEYTSEINKLAYSENIYGDRLAQILYTENVDLDGVKDNLGRELGEVYLTIMKRNAGYNKWYAYEGGTNKQATINNKEVEVSHCFGELTSGLDLSAGITDYNVRRIHNVDFATLEDDSEYSATSKIYSCVKEEGSPIEYNITKDNYDTFYGDIVEFSPSDYKENIIESVYYRFNTAQRETLNHKYFDLTYDELERDDDEGLMVGQDFLVSATTLNLVKGVKDKTYVKFAGNIDPEGYYYKAHNKIKIKEEADTISTAYGVYLNYDRTTQTATTHGDYVYLMFVSPMVYSFEDKDNIYLYNKETKNGVWAVLESIRNSVMIIRIEAGAVTLKDLEDGKYKVIEAFQTIPQYAQYIDAFQYFVWREYKKISELNEDSDLYDRPFTNGVHYIEQTMDIFVRRQDPFGEYGLSKPESTAGVHEYVSPLRGYRIEGHKVDYSKVNFINNDNIICY